MKVELEHVKIMNLKPDSIIVYEVEERLSLEQFHKIAEQLSVIAKDHKVIILDKSSSLKIIDNEDLLHATELKYGDEGSIKARYNKPEPPKSRIVKEGKF